MSWTLEMQRIFTYAGQVVLSTQPNNSVPRPEHCLTNAGIHFFSDAFLQAVCGPWTPFSPLTYERPCYCHLPGVESHTPCLKMTRGKHSGQHHTSTLFVGTTLPSGIEARMYGQNEAFSKLISFLLQKILRSPALKKAMVTQYNSLAYHCEDGITTAD